MNSTPGKSDNRKHLVLVGGGHAHMMVLENIVRFVERQIKVTVIGPSFHHYYSGMGPGMLGKTYQPSEIRFATQDVVRKQGGVFVKDYVVKIDPKEKKVYTASGHEFNYDVLSVNAGSYVAQATSLEEDNIYSVKPIEKLMQASEVLEKMFAEKIVRVAVVGGGPSSAEVAGNIWQLGRKAKKHMPEIVIYAGKKFMSGFDPKISQRVLNKLTARGIKIDKTGYVKDIATDGVTLDSGKKSEADFIFVATGVKPAALLEESGLPVGPDKGLKVNRFLQCVDYPEIFGGGDCIYYDEKPLDKVGVYAVRQNPVLLHNLMAQLEEKPLQVFDPGPDYLLIFNIGGGYGVLRKKRLIFGGRLAFWIKDFIDRRFMKRFQAIEKKL